MWVWGSQPPGGAPREGDAVSPGQVRPAHSASDTSRGGYGLFSVQWRKAGTQRQEEEAGQGVRAYHLAQRKERKKLPVGCMRGPCMTTCQQCFPGPGQPSKAGGSTEPNLPAARGSVTMLGDQAFIFLAGSGAECTDEADSLSCRPLHLTALAA